MKFTLCHGLIRTWGLLACLSLTTQLLAEERPQAAQVQPVPQQMFQYVNKPDPDFSWTLEETIDSPIGKVHRLNLVSQKWQGILWQHALMVYEPDTLTHPHQMLLFVNGGSIGNIPSIKDYPMGLQLAKLCGARVAMLHQVPNQPLMNGRKEDDLISETWLEYLKTGDESWPLLFPMVKSATKAMDALQAFSKEKLETQVDSFVITGASKRGWTSWLTAAADKRIIATAPMVIDVLNFPEQMTHQKETWGFYSEQIADYTSKGLVHADGIPKEGRERALWEMMDPYTYRDQITVPKLLIVGANDRYWSIDAMSIYWNDLKGPKAQHRVPNAGHNLDDGADGRKIALQTLAVFFRLSAQGKLLPEIHADNSKDETHLGVSMKCDAKVEGARLWTCSSTTKDFRDSKWTAQKLITQEGVYAGKVDRKAGEHTAVFGELLFSHDGIKYSLTTLVNWE